MLRDTTSRAYEYPALCIPRALGQVTEEELYEIMNQAGLGVISKIVLKPKEFTLPVWEQTKSPSAAAATAAATAATATAEDHHPEQHRQTVCYNNIYIYFKQWNTADPRVCKYRDNIINGQSIKIVHNAIPTPIFWRCVAANFTTSKQIK
jgi:hypothetical protein